MQDVLDKHYKRLARKYDEFLYYSPEFVRTLTTKMIDKLRLKPADTLADIGGGTGMYSLDILRQVPLEHPVICVDPYEDMLAQIPKEAPITAVAADAVEFSERPGAYNKVLIKETIHHVERKPDLFANLRRNLPDDGVLLLVHVPPDVQYPLFDKALERCLGWHADPEDLVALLDEAGFAVEREGLDYRHRLPKAHYFRMVAGCYMSVLTSFSETELAAGLEEMEQRYAGQDTLEFVDHFDYLTATPK